MTIPLSLTFPDQGSLLFETNESGDAVAASVMNNIILRLLATTPPGKLSFTIIDPVGLGQGFAGLMHLADYEESLLNRRIWTQRDQIDDRLSELGEHIEKVIQMYLRNEYATITEYNERAGSVAEKYHFLVIADFPSGFSENAARHLQSIATSGPRCGVFTLIHWDQRQPLPDGFVPDELRKNSVCLHRDPVGFFLTREQAGCGAALEFDSPPDASLALSLVNKIGKSSIDSNRVQVPFSQIAPKESEMWTNDTTSELRIPIGRTGATKLQYLAIGKGTRQHALFAGKTGSGKSTLFHVIITNLALSCSPEQGEFYLIDFKKGVEFKCYASKRLPHARVIAIESDREFALSVLQRVDDELKRRGDMFRKLGVQDVAGYKKSGGTEPMPRSLLLIDEFQEFFVEDDTIAQTASLLFDRIVRQGRAFGIHVLLGSQSLGGAYTLARATMGQMVIRVALQCNEADAYLIMDDNNAAPRLLSRPGEGIYNDAGGAIEGNNPFQVVWLPDDERDEWLDKVSEVARQKHDRHSGPIVFEGNAPADIRENDLLQSAINSPPMDAPVAARCWLGAPNSIKGPTQA
ncbi:MAG: FtsK/SpoIIIE domain-containing protein, partial [Verrucomicrobiaceae bacterium]